MIRSSANLVIITVHSGPIIFLKKTLQSIDTQTVAPHHNIVVASRTSLYRTKYLKKNNRTFIINKDKSIYNAMNIALRDKVIKNNYIIFLNSGDVLLNKRSIFNIKKYFLLKKIIIGSQILNLDNDYYQIRKCFFVKKNYSPHGSFLCHSSLLNSLNKEFFFDEKRLIDADGKWMTRIINNSQKKFIKINANISIHSLGGISTSPSIKTILHYLKINLSLCLKESLKFILKILLTKKFYFRFIYIVKYKHKKKYKHEKFISV
jgi:hypothetical protein